MRPRDLPAVESVSALSELLSLEELVRRTALAPSLVAELMSLGALEPSQAGEELRFDFDQLFLMRRMAHWQREFDLSPAATALVLAFMQRVEALENRIRELECSRLDPGP